MGLLGKAALVLSFDIDESAIIEHDEWHSCEHLQERMSIPGFLRGSRWISTGESPRYFVLYEVDQLDALASGPYLDRLDNPSAWTARMMRHYRGMQRGFCRLTFSVGDGLGGYAFVLKFHPGPEKASALRGWLVSELLPPLAKRRGLVGAHLFESGLAAEMTEEQRIRGKDSDVAWVLLVTGYDAGVVAALSEDLLSAEMFASLGVTDLVAGEYLHAHTLLAAEVSK